MKPPHLWDLTLRRYSYRHWGYHRIGCSYYAFHCGWWAVLLERYADVDI